MDAEHRNNGPRNTRIHSALINLPFVNSERTRGFWLIWLIRFNQECFDFWAIRKANTYNSASNGNRFPGELMNLSWLDFCTTFQSILVQLVYRLTQFWWQMMHNLYIDFLPEIHRKYGAILIITAGRKSKWCASYIKCKQFYLCRVFN